MIGSDIYILSVFGMLAFLRPIFLFGTYHRREKENTRVKKEWLQPLQLATFYFILALSLSEHFVWGKWLFNWTISVGCVFLIILSQILKVAAIRAMGHYWSPHVEIHKEKHSLIESGPYAFMRHPSYLNGIMEGICAPLISGSWVTFPFAILLIGAVFRLRILAEEDAMREQFRHSYEEYCQRVSRFGIKGEHLLPKTVFMRLSKSIILERS
ncbi:MAG: isoprenylcysteine carboxylmethyltransferase family protein [Sulfuricella sp.]|nr:isoprenylcysteine carboxylmethyltransferase family protein [Sulfuricella sp.]